MKGQTLIEVLVALGTGIVVVSAIAVVAITSLNNASYGASQNQATQYAQQGMELIRRLSNSNALAGYIGEYCLGANQTTPAHYANSCLLPAHADCTPPNILNTYVRQLCILPASDPNNKCTSLGTADTTDVRVDVFWSDGKCTSSDPYCHYSESATCLANPNTIQAP